MHPEMAFVYPLWLVSLVLLGVAVGGAVLLELAIRRLIPLDTRRRHNDVAAAMFSIVGVTYAVLLAFVAMLAWDGYNHARSATHTEAARLVDLFVVTQDFPALRADLRDYARAVIDTEWPAQAAGRTSEAGAAILDRIGGGTWTATADPTLRALVLQMATQLRDAREERILAAETTIPAIVWFVLLLGGILTVAYGSFLGAPSLRMHLAMSSLLAVSGVLVLVLIFALGNPFRGDLRIPAAPFEQGLVRMAALAAPSAAAASPPPAPQSPPCGR